MNFKDVDDRGDEEIEPKAPIKIILRSLTEDQAKQADLPLKFHPAAIRASAVDTPFGAV